MPASNASTTTTKNSINGKHPSIKLVILGDSGVGKTSLLIRYIHGSFHPFVASTIGASFFTTNVTCRSSVSSSNNHHHQEDSLVELKIWDTAGQERYQSLTPLYFRGAAAALLVYDVTKIHSLERLRGWVRELLQYNNNNTPQEKSNSNTTDNIDTATATSSNNNMILIVVGQKCDLAKDHVHPSEENNDENHHNYRSVSEETAREFARSINAMYIETSARENINVNAVFEMVAQAALDNSQSPTMTAAASRLEPGAMHFPNTESRRIDFSASQSPHANKCC